MRLSYETLELLAALGDEPARKALAAPSAGLVGWFSREGRILTCHCGRSPYTAGEGYA